jgi:hypothetical protein
VDAFAWLLFRRECHLFECFIHVEAGDLTGQEP